MPDGFVRKAFPGIYIGLAETKNSEQALNCIDWLPYSDRRWNSLPSSLRGPIVLHIAYPLKGEQEMNTIQRQKDFVASHYLILETIISKIPRNATQKEQISTEMPMIPILLVRGYHWKPFMGMGNTKSNVSPVRPIMCTLLTDTLVP